MNLHLAPPMKRVLLSFLPCLLAAQTALEPAHIQAFQTSARTVRQGGTVTLRWSATGAEQVRLDPLGLILPAKGEITHLVTGRTVYWLHVTNGAGGQSAPLVVDIVPEETAPAAPSLPIPSALPVPSVLPPVMPLERPRLAALPTVPSGHAPVLRVSAPHPPMRPGTRSVWIQFAATVSTRGAARLQRTLQRTAATDSTLMVRHRRAGRPYQLIRSGPFPSVQAARFRLQELAPAMKALGMKPIVVLGPAQPISLGTTFIADSRQP